MKEELLITCYANPDIDGFACAVAYSEYLEQSGKVSRVFVSGVPHDEVVYVMQKFNFALPSPVENPGRFEKIVLVDASTVAGIDAAVDFNKVVEVIDHRKINDASKFPNARIQIEPVGSAATLVAEKYMDEQRNVSAMSGVLLYSAIVSNTLNFQASVTTERDKRAATWLLSKIQVPERFVEEAFAAKSDVSGGKLSKRMKGEFASFPVGSKQLGIIQVEILNAGGIVKERKQEIVNNIVEAKEREGMDFCFASFIDLNHGQNLFVCPDERTQKLLEEVSHVPFTDSVAIRPGLIMRKEIVPLLKNHLEA